MSFTVNSCGQNSLSPHFSRRDAAPPSVIASPGVDVMPSLATFSNPLGPCPANLNTFAHSQAPASPPCSAAKGEGDALALVETDFLTLVRELRSDLTGSSTSSSSISISTQSLAGVDVVSGPQATLAAYA